MVALLAALGLFWTMRGEHAPAARARPAIAEAVGGWTPPPELEDATRAALAITLSNGVMTRRRAQPARSASCCASSARATIRASPAWSQVLLAYDRDDAAAFERAARRQADDPDRNVALAARQWLSHVRENAGDPAGAIDAAERALGARRPATTGPG